MNKLSEFRNKRMVEILTDEDDEAVGLLRGALVQNHLLVRSGQGAAAGRARGA